MCNTEHPHTPPPHSASLIVIDLFCKGNMRVDKKNSYECVKNICCPVAGVYPPSTSGSLGCLLARTLCLEDSACNQILQVIPRVCGLELGTYYHLVVSSSLSSVTNWRGPQQILRVKCHYIFILAVHYKKSSIIQ